MVSCASHIAARSEYLTPNTRHATISFDETRDLTAGADWNVFLFSIIFISHFFYPPADRAK